MTEGGMSAARARAPVVLFVFARPEHTRRTLEALAANALADQTDLTVYADAAPGEKDVEPVRRVRKLAHSAKGFRSVHVIEREQNYGLARNIIEGVTEMCHRHGRVIVLEDDIVTGPNFLSFMNAALDRYVGEKRVWHVSGWNYPIAEDGLGNAFLWRAMNCWGWATWSDRWKFFSKDPTRLISSWKQGEIKRFNLDGAHDFWAQVSANHSGKKNTWAIFWYATIFEAGGLCLNPARSFVHNIGNDGSGQNCGKEGRFGNVQSGVCVQEFPDRIEESTLAVRKVQAFYRSLQTPFLRRAWNLFTRPFRSDRIHGGGLTF